MKKRYTKENGGYSGDQTLDPGLPGEESYVFTTQFLT